MKFASFDIETTGLDRDKDQVLQMAFVIEDTEHPEIALIDLPTFECLIYRKRISGHPAALLMHTEIFECFKNATQPGPGEPLIVDFKDKPIPMYDHLDNACVDASAFLRTHLDFPFVVAGKNVAGFDMQFMPQFFKDRFHHRVIDVGSVAMGTTPSHWFDKVVPGLPTLSLKEWPVTHSAINDAHAVIASLRHLTGGYRG